MVPSPLDSGENFQLSVTGTHLPGSVLFGFLACLLDLTRFTKRHSLYKAVGSTLVCTRKRLYNTFIGRGSLYRERTFPVASCSAFSAAARASSAAAAAPTAVA